MTDKRFGNRFKECREKLNMTQQQLAEITKTPVSYISKVERGESYPRFSKMVLLLNSLKASADDVFCDVVEGSMKEHSKEVLDKLDGLPLEVKANILELVEVMIRQYHKSQEKTEPEQIDNPPKT